MGIQLSETTKQWISYVVSAIGATGLALQNYVAVELFIRGIALGVTSITKLLSGAIHLVAIGFGGISSGMVNFFINMDLLDSFIKRMTSESSSKPLTGWNRVKYIAGIVVFAVTGLLFGLTAFTFGITTPFAALAVFTGAFVAIIMTIQELETWLQSFDEENTEVIELSFGRICGHIIAAGNVIGLSLLFTLGLTEALIVFQVAAFPALIVGLCVAFTGGAFTEFYFYNFFLAKFCHKFDEKFQEMKSSAHSSFGFFCIISNSLVNAALTYSGVGLLTGLLTAAGVTLPPVGIIITLSAVSGLFSGAASFLLGMDFWIRKNASKSENIVVKVNSNITDSPSVDERDLLVHTPGLSFFKSLPKYQQVAGNDENVEEQVLVSVNKSASLSG